jgi:hypothetical protein
MIKLEKEFPCFLHLENQGCKRIITHEEETVSLIQAIERVINERLFGELDSPSNWKFPVNDDGTMGDVQLPTGELGE